MRLRLRNGLICGLTAAVTFLAVELLVVRDVRGFAADGRDGCSEGCGVLDGEGNARTCANCENDPSLWTVYPKGLL